MRISFAEAVRLLNSGEVAAVPTETVYGLAASLNHPQAIEKIYALKKRPLDNPLIVHVSSIEQVKPFVLHFPPDFERIATRFWPGSLTMVLPIVEEKVPARARAGLPTAGFRLPEHAIARELIEQTGPLVMPSANLSGKPSATSAEHVEEDFVELPVLDGGVCEKGLESTVICFHQGAWEIIRLGCLSAADLKEALGYEPRLAPKSAKPLCPGQMYKHYAPKAKLHLVTSVPIGVKAVVGYHDHVYEAERFYALGRTKNPTDAMKNLYSVLRQLDRDGVEEAFIDMCIPQEGLWATIRERLQRASQSM